MNSKQQELYDFLPSSGIFGLSDFNDNNFFPQNKQNKGEKRIQGEFNPIFFSMHNENENNQSKENEEADKMQNKNPNTNNRKNLNAPSYFFHDYDDDSENNDNERLIINTINDLEDFDDSNHYGNINFDNQENQNFSYPYDPIFSNTSNNFTNNDQGNWSDGNFVQLKNRGYKATISDSNLKTNVNTPKNNNSNSFSNYFLKDNALEHGYLGIKAKNFIKDDFNNISNNEANFDSNSLKYDFKNEFLGSGSNGFNPSLNSRNNENLNLFVNKNSNSKINSNKYTIKPRNYSDNNLNRCFLPKEESLIFNKTNNNLNSKFANSFNNNKNNSNNFISNKNNKIYNELVSNNTSNNFYNSSNTNFENEVFYQNNTNNNNLINDQAQNLKYAFGNGEPNNQNIYMQQTSNFKTNNQRMTQTLNYDAFNSNNNNNFPFASEHFQHENFPNFQKNTTNVYSNPKFNKDSCSVPTSINNIQKTSNNNLVNISDSESSIIIENQIIPHSNSAVGPYCRYSLNSNNNFSNSNNHNHNQNLNLNLKSNSNNNNFINDNSNKYFMDTQNQMIIGANNHQFNNSFNVSVPQKFNLSNQFLPGNINNSNYINSFNPHCFSNKQNPNNFSNCVLQNPSLSNFALNNTHCVFQNNYVTNPHQMNLNNSTSGYFDPNCNIIRSNIMNNNNYEIISKNLMNKNKKKNKKKKKNNKIANDNNNNNKKDSNNNINYISNFNSNISNNLCISFQSENSTNNSNVSQNNCNNLNLLLNTNNLLKHSEEAKLESFNSNKVLSCGSTRGSLCSAGSANLNDLANSSLNNLEDFSLNSKLKNLSLNGYFTENNDWNLKDSSFSSERKSQNNSVNSLKSGKNPIKSSCNKKSLFNKEKKENEKVKEETQDLINFLNTLSVEIDEFVCSQKGSRNLQKYLDRVSPEEINYLIKLIAFKFSKLMKDMYGNYFCQKLMQICSQDQRIQILKYISCEIVAIAHHTSGTHALQSFLDYVCLAEEENIILSSIENDVVKMCYDNDATHVIQKIIICFEESKRTFINTIVVENLKDLVLNSNGICVVKKLIISNKSLDVKAKISEKIKNNFLEIIQSPYGNYVIQHVIEQWGYEYCRDLVDIIISSVVSLSMQKFSSNVVEKIIDNLSQGQKKKVITEFFNPSKFMSFIKNKFCNFVILKLLKEMSNQEKKETKEFIVSNIIVTSTKEKNKLNSFLENMVSFANLPEV